MGSFFTKEKPKDLNLYVFDYYNDDFFTKFKLKNTYSFFSIKNNIKTLHPTITKKHRKYEENVILKDIGIGRIPLIKLDKNKFDYNSKYMKKYIDEFKEILLKYNNCVSFKIYILLDSNCFIFLELLNYFIINNLLNPTDINIQIVNNMTKESKQMCNLNFQDITHNFNKTCDKYNIDYTYNVLDYCRALMNIDNPTIERPIYFSGYDFNIQNIKNYKLLYDYYIDYHEKLLPFYLLPFITDNSFVKTYLNINNDLIMSDNNEESIVNTNIYELDKHNYYKFKLDRFGITKYLTDEIIYLLYLIDKK